MYSILISGIAMIFAYASVKSNKLHFQLLFLLISMQYCALAGTSAVNRTINLGDQLLSMSIWIMLVICAFTLIDLTAGMLKGIAKNYGGVK